MNVDDARGQDMNGQTTDWVKFATKTEAVRAWRLSHKEPGLPGKVMRWETVEIILGVVKNSFIPRKDRPDGLPKYTFNLMLAWDTMSDRQRREWLNVVRRRGA